MPLLLTWLGTVLYVDRASGAVVHGDAWPIPLATTDLAFDVPLVPAGPTAVPGLPGVLLEPAGRAGVVHVRNDTHDLFPHPVDTGTFFHPRGAVRPRFLLVSEQNLENLRFILAHAWAFEGEPAPAAGDEMLVRLSVHFTLNVDGLPVDLAATMPRILPLGHALPGDPNGFSRSRFEITTGDRVRTLERLPHGAPRDILLRHRDSVRAPPVVTNLEDFRSIADCQLHLVSPSEWVKLPITVCAADFDWMHEKPWSGIEPTVGRASFPMAVMRESDKFVSCGRGIEGTIFDHTGISNETGYLHGLAAHPLQGLVAEAGLRRRGNQVCLSEDAARLAPRLHGPHVVFYGGNLSNYAHWLIDGLLQLNIMLPYLPAGTKLLMPGTLRAMQQNPHKVIDHFATLAPCGFGDMAITEIDGPVCHVDEVYWLDAGHLPSIPAVMVHDFRDRILSRRPPAPRQDRMLYIARRQTRRVADAVKLEGFLQRHGFEQFFLEDLSFESQIDLFMQAAFVIAPHGAEMANLLFCPPGTKVLELAPDSDFKPYFSCMSSKLKLAHGVLPCPTHDGGFFGDMQVDLVKFAALYRMLKNHL
jgi:hypothetical protein